jgi:hypothetical protein
MKRLLALGVLAGLLAGCAAIPSQDYERRSQSGGTDSNLRKIDIYEYDNNWIDYGAHLHGIA